MGRTIGLSWELLGPRQWICSNNVGWNNDFIWAVPWADQCVPLVIPMSGKTVALHGQFHGPTMSSSCNTNVWQNGGLKWAVSWVNQCERQAIPASGKTVVLQGQLHGPTRVKAYNSNVWQGSGLYGQFHNQCESNVMPMCAKQWLYMGSFMGRPMYAPCNANVWQNNGLQGQFHGPIHANPIECQRQFLDRLQYKYIFAGRILSQAYPPPHLNLTRKRSINVDCCNEHMLLVSPCFLVSWSYNRHVSGHFFGELSH